MTDAPTLKPCPFCGGEAELWQAHPGRKAWVACMGRCAVLVTAEHQTNEEAIATWNRRALPADDAEMVEKVAAAILASRATSDEGPFDPLWQLLDFAPNNNRIIARAAARAALSAMRGEP